MAEHLSDSTDKSSDTPSDNVMLEPIRLPAYVDSVYSKRSENILGSSATAIVLIVFGFTVGGFAAGWWFGSSTTAANPQVVRAAVATSLSQIVANATNIALDQLPPTLDPLRRFKVETGASPVIGPKDALVTIVEFSDFQCPFCKRFFNESEAALLQKYQGKLRFVYRHFPLDDIHPYARPAAEASECATEQGKFWEYHNVLLQNAPQLTNIDLVNYAQQVGINMPQFQDCFNSRRYATAVQVDYEDAIGLGLSGTPAFFINGRFLSGAQPYAVFSQFIDDELTTQSTKPTMTPLATLSSAPAPNK